MIDRGRTPSQPPPPLPAAARARRVWSQPLAWLLLWALLATAVRLAVSPMLSWVQAEQAVWSQALAWGYGPQPPLYTWLQWGVNALLGPSLLALLVVKNALMVASLGCLYLAARELLPARTAWLAALGMWWLPGMAWLTVRDLSHSVLLTFAVCASWWLLLRQLRRPSPAGFAALGVVVAVGLLAKYSYLMIAAAALLAALSLSEGRRALLSRGWWLAPLVAFLLVLPHAWWVVHHWFAASQATLTKMALVEGNGSRLHAVLGGMGDLAGLMLVSLLAWSVPALLAFGGRWFRAQPAAATSVPAWAPKLLARYAALIVLGLVALALLGVSRFDGRWIHPMVCVLPLWAFVWRPAVGEDARGARRYLLTVVGLVLVLGIAVPMDPILDARRGRTDRFNWPVEQMAAALHRGGYDGRGTIVADSHLLGGLLRTRFPAARVEVCDAGDRLSGPFCVRRMVAIERARCRLAAGRGGRPRARCLVGRERPRHLERGPHLPAVPPHAPGCRGAALRVRLESTGRRASMI